MTDRELLEKKLAFIETCVRELRELSQPSLLDRDIREQRFVEHTLQIAIQALIDAASHIVSDERLGEPNTNRELFELLAKGRWIPDHLGRTMQKMVGFRNIVVHGYQIVDLAILKEIVLNKLDDLLEVVTAIRDRLSGS